MNWNMGYLMQLATGYWPAATLIAAVETGVFEALRGGAQSTATDLARAMNSDPRALAELLDALVAMDALERSDSGLYRIAPGAAELLDPSSSRSQVDALRYNRDLYGVWGKLSESVRTGKPAIPPTAHLGADPDRTRRFALGMHSRALGLAPALLPAIRCPPGDATGEFRLLDVGSGPGTFSRMLAERNPRLRVIQFDLPPVLRVAQDLTTGTPAADRIFFQPGDYRTDELGESLDGVLYCGALHQESPESAGPLFQKFHAALRPGGRVWVVDLMTAPGRRGPLMAHLFSLNMLLTSPRGRVFAEDETAALLRQGGFTQPEIRRCEAAPYSVVEARRD